MTQITDLSREWSLGDNSDCETCGYTYNEVVFQDWKDDGQYQLYMSVGCYGGDTYTLDEIDRLILDIQEYEYYTEGMKKDILSTIKTFKEKYEIK
jgi:hypothetical protein